MNIVDRLKIYMEHTELPISQFADAALIPRPTLSQILSGRNKKISNEVLEKLHDAFPSLNVAWLLFGEGKMLRDEVAAAHDAPHPGTQVRQATTANPCQQTIPLNEEVINELTKPHLNSPAEKNPEPQIALAPDANKKIQTIMVFYTDNSFEIFTPSQR